jgi:tripartite-type tricarboxylate transporter receptor subunit TctC
MKKLLSLVAFALALGVGVEAAAQTYPSKPVRFVFAFPPGSAADIVGRQFTQKLAEYWGQPAVVDNRVGAGGTIAAGVVARAEADGYTLLIHSSGHAVNPSMFKSLPYDAATSFVDISPLAKQPNVLVVAPNAPYRSMADFVKAAQANPGRLNVASAGVGSGTHLNLEKFKFETRIDVNHVPYRGSAEALTDVMGGSVNAFFAPISASVELIRSGRVRALAVSTSDRSTLLPDVPTIAESGVAGFESSLWFGVWAPAGTPAEIVEKLSRDIRRAQADLRAPLGALGNEIVQMSPSEFKSFVSEEMKSSAALLKAAGIQPQ